MSRQSSQKLENSLIKKEPKLRVLDGFYRLNINDGSEKSEEEQNCDSNLDSLLSGIVGILEGFGLLDHTNNETKLPEDVKDYIQAVLENGSQEQLESKLQGNVVSDFNARMQQINHDRGIPKEAQEMIQQLVDEYQCSFENTNNKGVENQKLEPNTIMQMLQSAINESGGKVKLPPKKAETQDSIIKTDYSIESAVVQSPQSSDKPQNVDFAQSLEPEQQVPTTHDMEENIAKIVDKVSSTLLEGKQEFDVKLKPEFLGKLSIKLTIDDSGIKAHIKAADLSVKGLIADQLPTLTESLREKGVNMANIEVVYDNPTLNDGNGQFQRQNPQKGSGRKNLRYKIAGDTGIDSITYDLMTDLPDVSVRNSSVEYSA